MCVCVCVCVQTDWEQKLCSYCVKCEGGLQYLHMYFKVPAMSSYTASEYSIPAVVSEVCIFGCVRSLYFWLLLCAALEYSVPAVCQKSVFSFCCFVLQQHGSVYWKRGARQMLNSLQPDKTFTDQLKVTLC